MQVIIQKQDRWQQVKNDTMTTIGKNTGAYPDSIWKRKLLLSEHSPIRNVIVNGKIFDIPYWVSVHFVRHKFGVDWFCSTQRTDRTGIKRDDLAQGNLIDMSFVANAQAIMNISRKRLCNCASKETRDTWKMVLDELKKTEPELVSCCVPDCVYRGKCYEMFPCGYDKTEAFQKQLLEYRGE